MDAVPSQTVSALRSRAVIGGVIVFLVATTIWAFVLFDEGSHSASDTLRPLLVTIVPLWFAAIAVARYLVSSKRGPKI